jgi:hypothetical protein
MSDAVVDGEGGLAQRPLILDGQTFDAGERRQFLGEAVQKRVERFAGALDFDDDAVRDVEDVALKVEPGRQPVDERPEAYALDYAANPDATPLGGFTQVFCGTWPNRGWMS